MYFEAETYVSLLGTIPTCASDIHALTDRGERAPTLALGVLYTRFSGSLRFAENIGPFWLAAGFLHTQRDVPSIYLPFALCITVCALVRFCVYVPKYIDSSK